MAFIRVSSPHTHNPNTTRGVMLQVLLATLPGVAALTVYFGPGTLVNLAMACLFALSFEAAALKLRKKPIAFYLNDLSATVTAVLLALALPPYCPWWIVACGIFFSIVVAKHLYGGLGYNPFNPAMVGYVVLLISFPVEMTQWALPTSALSHTAELMASTSEGLAVTTSPWGWAPILSKFGLVSAQVLDGISGATPLDLVKQTQGQTIETIYQNSALFSHSRFAGAGWEWVNLAFLAGGIYLLYKKVFTWHAPVSLLLTLGVLAGLFYDSGSSNSAGSPLFHWVSGGTMLGAFFIITDPVSSAVSNKGRILFGACAGLLIFVIRVWGNYPDAVAFAVLLMNFAAPFIDYYTLPRTYGHSKAGKATSKQP